MNTYELFQIARHRSELRCAMAAQARNPGPAAGREAVARVLEDIDVIVDPRDESVARHMMVVGFWEWWISQAIADCMRPGTLCVDVGANAGYFTALFAGLGAAGIVAIEPHPELARRLRATGAHNGWRGLEVVECAVGDRDGRAQLLVHGDDNLGGSTIVQQASAKTVEVRVATLDRLLGDLAPIQVIKIDCEGSEPRIWRGMQRVLSRNPDVHVLAEVTVNAEAAPWLEEVRAQGWPLRFVDYDAEVKPLAVDELASRPLWMLYLHAD